MKKSVSILFFALWCGLFSVTSCEKPSFDDENVSGVTKPGNQVPVTFRLTAYEMLPFDNLTRAAVPISEAAVRISFAVFKENGDLVKRLYGRPGDSNFGTFSLELEKGTYTVVAIAHNGDETATITSPQKVTFSNKQQGITDTFYACESITVNEGGTQDLSLKRAVAKFRLLIEDDMPSSVNEMYFYYTGGSSTFNPSTGFGSTNSNQSESFAIDASYHGKPSQFDIYTFPHEAEDLLKVQVKALSSSGVVATKTLENVPVSINMVTQYRGKLFDGENPNPNPDDGGGTTPTLTPSSFVLKADTTWTRRDFTF